MKVSSLTASLLAAALVATVAPAMAQNAAVVNGKAIPSAKVDALLKKSGQPESP
ncbi:MAG: peptidylprolyl isomerase, partial [Ralstonia sp.]